MSHALSVRNLCSYVQWLNEKFPFQAAFLLYRGVWSFEVFMLLTLCKGWEDCSPACMYPMMGGEWIQNGGSFCLFACLFVFLNEKKWHWSVLFHSFWVQFGNLLGSCDCYWCGVRWGHSTPCRSGSGNITFEPLPDLSCYWFKVFLSFPYLCLHVGGFLPAKLTRDLPINIFSEM